MYAIKHLYKIISLYLLQVFLLKNVTLYVKYV